MNNKTASEDDNPGFQVKIGEEIAWVEVVSEKSKIYAVELPRREVIFITKVNNKQPCWVSIPQGQDELAEKIGELITNRNKK